MDVSQKSNEYDKESDCADILLFAALKIFLG
jgi:hypothetical protein